MSSFDFKLRTDYRYLEYLYRGFSFSVGHLAGGAAEIEEG
jgi:hypothetical protein